MTKGWQLYTRDENRSPPVEGLDAPQHATKDDALEAAWQLLYGLTRNAHIKVLYIQGPDGQRIESDEIEAWCKQRSAASR